jgi:hypothetical protein
MRYGLAGCVLFISCLLAQGPAPSVTIQIVEGDGAINSIRLHRAHEPVVRVVDAGGEPIGDAAVTFVLPATGASGSFGDSGLSLTVQTDSRGIATGRGLRPNGVAGQFRIRVAASWRSVPAVATVVQTNAEPVVKSGHGKTIAILAVVVGAVAGGAAVAARGGKSAPAAQASVTGAQTPGSISAGTPSVGPPH